LSTFELLFLFYIRERDQEYKGWRRLSEMLMHRASWLFRQLNQLGMSKGLLLRLAMITDWKVLGVTVALLLAFLLLPCPVVLIHNVANKPLRTQ
jgi:hypothetical protein